MDVLSIAIGAALVFAAYFVYLAATKGLPAAWAWLKAKWTAGKAAAAKIETDLSGLGAKVTALENRVEAVEWAVKPKPVAAAPAAAVPTATAPAAQ